jgi:hypothetical protein
MGRSAAEMAALDALREALARSESLATLAPRLANLDASIAEQMPPDRSQELKEATHGLNHALNFCRPGHLTRAGRLDRRRLEVAQARYDALVAHQDARAAWLEDHADTLAYREELAEAVTRRRRELGAAAAVTQPDHVVELIGAPPAGDPGELAHWTTMAGRIEGYREHWSVEPDELLTRPVEPCQAQDWDLAIETARVLMPPPAPGLERGLDMGIDLGW